MDYTQTIDRLYDALDALLDIEAKCREMNLDNTHRETVDHINKLIRSAEKQRD